MSSIPVADEPPRVEVVYALPDEQFIVAVDFQPGLTALAAVEASGLLENHPAIPKRELVLGVFAEVVPHDHVLRAGDRVEITRPLQADPRTRRRELLQGGRVMSGASAPDVGIRKKDRG